MTKFNYIPLGQDIDVPGKLGENSHSRAGCPGTTGFAGVGNSRARTGAVCAPDDPRPGTAGKRVA
jgi:hypothetical protein